MEQGRTLAILFFGLIAVGLGGIALVDERPGYRLVMAALALAGVTMLVGSLWLSVGLREGVVQIDTEAPGLRFTPSPRNLIPLLILGVGFLLPGIAALLVELLSIPGASESWSGRRGPQGLGLLGLGLLVYQFWTLRHPLGLTLTPAGLRGVRGARRVDLAWDQLVSVDALGARIARLSLTTGDGRRVSIDALWMASDGRAVATVLRWYLEHPEDRHLLSDGWAALQHVREATRTS